MSSQAVKQSSGSMSQRDLFAIADRVLPGSGLGSYSLADEIRLIYSHGKGSRMWDVDGNEYIDYVGGAGALILGHSHASVVEAAKAQLDRGTRRRVEQFINKMREEVEKHNAIQDGLSFVEGYTLWKVDQTLTAGALLKAARHPNVPRAEMEAVENAARTIYMESAVTAMKKTVSRLVDRLEE